MNKIFKYYTNDSYPGRLFSFIFLVIIDLAFLTGLFNNYVEWTWFNPEHLRMNILVLIINLVYYLYYKFNQ